MSPRPVMLEALEAEPRSLSNRPATIVAESAASSRIPIHRPRVISVRPTIQPRHPENVRPRLGWLVFRWRGSTRILGNSRCSATAQLDALRRQRTRPVRISGRVGTRKQGQKCQNYEDGTTCHFSSSSEAIKTCYRAKRKARRLGAVQREAARPILQRRAGIAASKLAVAPDWLRGSAGIVARMSVEVESRRRGA